MSSLLRALSTRYAHAHSARRRAWALGALISLSAACNSSGAGAKGSSGRSQGASTQAVHEERRPDKVATSAAAPSNSSEVDAAAEASAPVKAGPRFVPHPAGVELKAAVANARQSSYAQGRQFLVYVGASWCEPCRYFHDAVLAGSLDEAFPKLDLMEFDLDEEKAALSKAGYQSRLIPLFSKANADGSASTQRHAGGIKGPRSVEFLSKKLEVLLAGQPGEHAI